MRPGKKLGPRACLVWFGLPDEVSHLCLIFLSLQLTQGECHTLAQQTGGTPSNREIKKLACANQSCPVPQLAGPNFKDFCSANSA
jgi:hypothetical protein